MKKIIIAVVLIALMVTCVSAQSMGYNVNRYYNQQYYISDVPVGHIYYRWDYMGYQHAFQQYKRAKWYSVSGGHNIYQWYNGQWQYNWSNGYAYKYSWVYYTKQLY